MVRPPQHPRRAATPASLLADGLAVERAGHVVVTDLTIRARGGVVAVLGPNGSGKTSLLRTLATVVAPAGGTLRIDGLDPNVKAQRTTIRESLAYTPQALRFAPRTRVFDAVDYVATLRLDATTAARQWETWRVLDRLDLGREASSRVGDLSEGTRQRVALAQGLLGDPRFAIFDEPLVALDPEIRLRAQEAIADLSRTCTIVVASHLVNEAVSFADQVIVMGDHGSPVFTGSPAELLAAAPEPDPTPAHGYLAVRAAAGIPTP